MSDLATALANVNAFEASAPSTVAWKLDRTQTLQRLRTLLTTPALIGQRGLNACAPAAFFRVWLARDPVGAAAFACTMLRDGTATIGSKTITASQGLLAQDYAAVRDAVNAAHSNAMPDTADWMLQCSLRDSENTLVDYLGEPYSVRDTIAGLTLPLTLTSWLTATNLYTTVANDTTVLPGVDNQRLPTLLPTSNVDIILLVNSSFNANFYPNLATRPLVPPSPGVYIPDHYVVMNGPFSLDAGVWLNVDVWTWGRTMGGWVGSADFGSRYYGLILATV
jgi:hypothetical protein